MLRALAGPRRAAAAIVGSALVMLVSACGTSTETGTPTTSAPSATSQASPTATPSTVNACALITPAEAATALGISGAPKTKVDTAGECSYEASDGIDEVSITLETEEYAPGTEDVVINLLGKDKATKVSGIGDAAFSYDIGIQAQFHFWAKGRYVLIALTNIGGGDVLGPARTLAEKAVTRL